VRVARRAEGLLSWLTVGVPTSRRYLTDAPRGGKTERAWG